MRSRCDVHESKTPRPSPAEGMAESRGVTPGFPPRSRPCPRGRLRFALVLHLRRAPSLCSFPIFRLPPHLSVVVCSSQLFSLGSQPNQPLSRSLVHGQLVRVSASEAALRALSLTRFPAGSARSNQLYSSTSRPNSPPHPLLGYSVATSSGPPHSLPFIVVGLPPPADFTRPGSL